MEEQSSIGANMAVEHANYDEDANSCDTHDAIDLYGANVASDEEDDVRNDNNNNEIGDDRIEGNDDNIDQDENNGSYNLDFNDYTDVSGAEEQEIIHDADDYDYDYDDDEEEEEAEEAAGDEDPNLSGLVVPDVDITRGNSLTSMATNDSGIFSNPRKPSVAFPHPSLKTLSEETHLNVDESDSSFINSISSSKNLSSSASTLTKSSTIASSEKSKIIDHHKQFVSNARYSESIISYGDETTDDNDDYDDDAFSFQENDDKEYEIGYTPHDYEDDYNSDGTDINNNSDTDIEIDDAGTDQESESMNTEKNQNSALPPIPFAPPIISQDDNGDDNNRKSIVNARELEMKVDAMRNEFVRSDMHPSIMSKATNVDVNPSPYISSKLTSVDEGNPLKAINKENVICDKEDNNSNTSLKKMETLGSHSSSLGSTKQFDKSTGSGSGLEAVSSKSESMKSIVYPRTPKDTSAVEKFENIPDVDIMQMLLNSKNASDNIKTLSDIRNDLNNIDTGLSKWILYNMGDSIKINMEDDKVGIHVREAIKMSEDANYVGNRNTFNGIVSIGDTMGNMAHDFGDFGGRNVTKIKEVVKFGKRGKTLLRKLKKVPDFNN